MYSLQNKDAVKYTILSKTGAEQDFFLSPLHLSQKLV